MGLRQLSEVGPRQHGDDGALAASDIDAQRAAAARGELIADGEGTAAVAAHGPPARGAAELGLLEALAYGSGGFFRCAAFPRHRRVGQVDRRGVDATHQQ
jgi:hypothetical protein